MKKIILALAALAMCACAKSEELLDKSLYSGVQAVTAIDWAQTRYIAKHPSEFYETNKFLGKHPSVGSVNGMFAARAVFNGLLMKLPTEYRSIALGSVLLVTTPYIVNNRKIGIGYDKLALTTAATFLIPEATGLVFTGNGIMYQKEF